MELNCSTTLLDLETGVKSVRDLIDAVDVLNCENTQLSVLVLNIKSIIDGGHTAETPDRQVLRPKFEENVSTSPEDIEKNRIAILKAVLREVSNQICAFQHCSSNNNGVSVLCQNVQTVLENATEESARDPTQSKTEGKEQLLKDEESTDIRVVDTKSKYLASEENPDWTTTDMINLLREVLTEKSDEMALIEKVFSDPLNVKNLQERMKVDITALIASQWGKLQFDEGPPSAGVTVDTNVAAATNIFIPSEINREGISKIASSLLGHLNQNTDFEVLAHEVYKLDPVLAGKVFQQSIFKKESHLAQNDQNDTKGWKDKRHTRFSPNRNISSNPPKDAREIFVKLCLPVPDLEIWTYFAQFGLVESVKKHMHPMPTKHSAGYCFVTFRNVEAVQEAIKRPEQAIYGKRVCVDRVKSVKFPHLEVRRNNKTPPPVTTPRRSSTSTSDSKNASVSTGFRSRDYRRSAITQVRSTSVHTRRYLPNPYKRKATGILSQRRSRDSTIAKHRSIISDNSRESLRRYKED